MSVLRSDIEKALDEIISNEEWMRFQILATVLAKQRWPELIACERKNDLGADAIATAAISPDAKGKVLAASLTAELGKIRDDAKKVKTNFDDVHIFIFVTPKPVTNQKKQKWATVLQNDFGYELVVIPREELINTLMIPYNAPLCRSFLGIDVPVPEPVAELVPRVREATTELTASWSRRLAGKPLLDLRTVRLDQHGEETGAILHLKDIRDSLAQCRRLVLEAPAGRGKTTTLIQLANLHVGETGIAFLIDLPLWISSKRDLLQFIAGMRPFQARSLDAAALARLHDSEHFSFLLNGWNEISESDSAVALDALRDLERNFPSAGIVVATRAHHINPPLPGALRARLLPLSRAERAEYLTRRFERSVDELRSKLDGEPVLDDLTRTPLILSAVCDIFESGAPIPTTRMGILHAVIELLETSEQHRDHLQLPPLAGRARDYLEDLASIMTAQGQATIYEKDARAIASSTASKLRNARQIASNPEPSAVVTALCARHILERQDYPTVTFRFEHQQFQAFLAASRVKADLWRVIHRQPADEGREFLHKYVNDPVWAEPLGMIAEEIGAHNIELREDADATKAGEYLVNMALSVDVVFAGELFRSCGLSVQARVRGAVAKHLRAWYGLSKSHRLCALAGMLATGSVDFNDIILPLLAHDDRQVRLELLRTAKEFHLSTLGADWGKVVSSWKEEVRADFVSEVIHHRSTPESVVAFALTDPSMIVRKAAVSAFAWIGSDEEVAQLLGTLDKETFETVVQELSARTIPLPMRPRARAMYFELYHKSADALARIRNLLRAAEMGGASVTVHLKTQLSALDPSTVENSGHYFIDSALNIIQREDPGWVSDWVAERIAGGSLWRDEWLEFVTSIPEEIKQTLLEKLENEKVEYALLSRSVSLLAARSDVALAKRIVRKLCALRREVTAAPDVRHDHEWTVQQQLGKLFRLLPVNVAVEGLATHLAGDLDAIDLSVVTELFGTLDPDESQLRSDLNENLRQSLRGYLKKGVAVVLQEDDFSGESKAKLATALAEAGDPLDMDDLRQLIRADIDRVRRGRAARARGDRSELAGGASMSYSNWHVRAVVRLDPVSADVVLLDVLKEAEYERDAAWALVRLARTQIVEKPFGSKKDFRAIWDARAGKLAGIFNEARRERYTIAIRGQIAGLLDNRVTDAQSAPRNSRARDLAVALASIDGRHSVDLILEVAVLPGDWGAWTRVDALEKLLFSGGLLPAPRTLQVIESVLAQIRSHHYDNQQRYLLQRILCILPFVDIPSRGFDAMRQLISEFAIQGYELCEVVAAVGCSRCDEALEFLRELLASERRTEQVWEACTNALAAIDDYESRELLLSFLDPDLPELSAWEGDVLAHQITELARRDIPTRRRILGLCKQQPPSAQRNLLARIISRLDCEEAVLAGLTLIDDQATPPVPRGIWQQLENVFVERRPYRDSRNTFTLVPRSSNAIRTRLFEMAVSDERRKEGSI